MIVPGMTGQGSDQKNNGTFGRAVKTPANDNWAFRDAA